MNGRSTWMSRLPDDTSISDIAIPGTHDSATYVLDLARGFPGFAGIALDRGVRFVQCQSLDIRAQLDAGVRFLDLRIMPGSRFPLHHGVVPLGIDLEDALSVVDAFLKDNESETVLISVKKESNDERDKTSRELKTYLDKRRGPMFTEARIPAVNEVRGRSVLINRVFEVKENGIFIWFEDNTIFSKTQKQGDGTELEFAVQDVYDPSPGFFNSTLAAKKRAIEKGYRDYSSGSYALRISFLSGSSAPTRTPGEYADDINPRVHRFLRDWTSGTPWITVLDYVGRYGKGAEDPVAAIISSNTLTKGGPSGARDTLLSGETLTPGQSLVSQNHAYRAEFRADGDFVVSRTVDDFCLAHTDTSGTKADRATLQDDGNFVVYKGSKAVAATMTHRMGKGDLAMQNDGNLVLYDQCRTPHWASQTSEFQH